MNKLTMLAKYAKLKSGDLTPSIVMEIAGALGIEADVDDSTMASISSLLATEDINELADLLGSPSVFPKLQKILLDSAHAEDTNMIICPHCGDYINPQA